jgi:hypothetical protein
MTGSIHFNSWLVNRVEQSQIWVCHIMYNDDFWYGKVELLWMATLHACSGCMPKSAYSLWNIHIVW